MLEEYENYIETLLNQNKLLEANGKKKLVRYGTDIPAPERASTLAGTYVTHHEFSGNIVAESLTRWVSVLHILQQVPPSGNLEANVRNARRRTLNLAEQLISRIVYDADTGASCELINGLEDEMAIDPLGLDDENAWGWSVTLRFTSIRHQYNEDEWLTQ